MAQTITFRTAKMETGQLVIDIPKEQRGSVMSWLKSKKDRDYDLTIKEHRKKRSLDANAYAWVLIGELAKVKRISPDEVYRQAITDIGGNYEVIPIREEAADHFRRVWESNGIGWMCQDMGRSKIPGYRNLRAYYGSSVYDTEQMSRLIDNLIQDCKALGIETLTPDKLALLKEEWQ